MGELTRAQSLCPPFARIKIVEAVGAARRTRILGPSDERLERLGEWYGAEHPRLVRFAYLLVRDDATAEDLVQEAFVRMYRTGARLDEAGLGAYARQTILNLTRSAFRRRRIERRLLDRLGGAEPTTYEPDSASVMDLRAALLRLPLADRACLVLRHFEGYTDREAAGVLGISEAAAKKRVARAHARLRHLLGEEEG
jgi:RNA polymerase sigma factor (sigma-70 family)